MSPKEFYARVGEMSYARLLDENQRLTAELETATVYARERQALVEEKQKHIDEIFLQMENLQDLLHKRYLQNNAMARLLQRVMHDGPNARTTQATPDCWKDCLGCAVDKLFQEFRASKLL